MKEIYVCSWKGEEFLNNKSLRIRVYSPVALGELYCSIASKIFPRTIKLHLSLKLVVSVLSI